MSLASYNYKNLAASGAVKAGVGMLHSISIAAGADAATAIVYDNTSAAAPEIVQLSAPLTGTAFVILDVPFSTGCYVAITGTAPSCTVIYA